MKKELLPKLRLLIRTQDLSDDLIEFYWDIIAQKVMNFCHIKEIPDELELIIIEMVANYANLKFAAAEGDGSAGPVESIKRGDTQISYGQRPSAADADLSIGQFITDYKAQLYPFRKLVVI